MIEALATGTPVVGTAVGAAEEIVEHGRTGFLGATEQLADFIPAAAGLDRAVCRSAVQGRFSAERMVADHLRLYAELIERRPPAGVPHAVPVDQNR